ncbi:hypothetical protein [Enterobacter huaxiensis]|uniref:hypothetical protein n=1 Tax=Enterobacter huaxiensis TaxID=2494702 RepID=UPI0021DA4FCD|nr:hypothetical protein [Enterobacter huaxiensis]
MHKASSNYVKLITQMLLSEQVSKEVIKLPDKTGDVVSSPIEIVIKVLFVLLKVIDVKETQRTKNVFLCPQMLLTQLIHSINCDEHDGQGSHVINHEMSSLVLTNQLICL